MLGSTRNDEGPCGHGDLLDRFDFAALVSSSSDALENCFAQDRGRGDAVHTVSSQRWTLQESHVPRLRSAPYPRCRRLDRPASSACVVVRSGVCST